MEGVRAAGDFVGRSPGRAPCALTWRRCYLSSRAYDQRKRTASPSSESRRRGPSRRRLARAKPKSTKSWARCARHHRRRPSKTPRGSFLARSARQRRGGKRGLGTATRRRRRRRGAHRHLGEGHPSPDRSRRESLQSKVETYCCKPWLGYSRVPKVRVCSENTRSVFICPPDTHVAYSVGGCNPCSVFSWWLKPM